MASFLHRVLLALALGVFTTSAGAEIIHLKARRGDVAGVLAELEKGVPVDIRSKNMTTEQEVTPLFIAAKFGQADVVRLLLERGADPTIFFLVPNGIYTTGTALHHAARNDNLEVVNLLLDAGADPASYEGFIGTPLHQARAGGNLDVAAALIAAGAPERVERPPIAHLLDQGDLARGQFLERGCQVCHGVPAPGAKPGDNGPNLWGIVGRMAGKDPDFTYSSYMAGSQILWTPDALNSYIAAPYQYLPGTSKVQIGMEDEADRISLIAYLATLAD